MTNDALLQLIEEQLSTRGYPRREPKGLFSPIAYTLGLGGKRLRPLLCLLATRLYSDDLSEALPIATALEIFHNFTLLHDDLMDRSPIRRGQPTVYKRWGDNVAILSGDVMSIEAYRCLEQLHSPHLLARVLPIFNQMAVEVCQGQQYDMEYEQRTEVSVAEYMEMIRLKTAVLLGAALRLGALAGGAPEEEAEQLDAVGQALGLAFQIQDDYLDVYGHAETFGKPIGGDIVNGKKTLMLLYTRGQLGAAELSELDRLMALPHEQDAVRIAAVRALYDQAGTSVYAQREIERLTSEANRRLQTIQAPQERLQPLYSLFDSLTSRQK